MPNECLGKECPTLGTIARTCLQVLILIVCACILFGASRTSADDVGVRLRVIWGGDIQRDWHGQFSVSDGELHDVRPLGLEADEPGSLQITGRTIPIRSPSPRKYDGFDVTVRARRDAVVRIDFADIDTERQIRVVDRPLQSFINGQISVPLDEYRNQVVVHRAPGDELRVELNRDSLVFNPNEDWRIDVLPHLTGFSPGMNLKLEVELTQARSEKQVWSADFSGRVGATGTVPPFENIDIPIPAQEGVYDVHFRLSRAGLRLNVAKKKRTVRRTIQLVVVDRGQPAAPKREREWKEILLFDPSQPKWLERMPSLPDWTRLGKKWEPAGNGSTFVEVYDGREVTRLEPGGIQAYPLPIHDVAVPHLLEIEYPSGIAQTLGVSILDPGPDGRVQPVGLDGGFDVIDQSFPADGPRTYQLMFWPRTKTPYVLLTNRRPETSAAFTRIRVLAGPAHLPVESPDSAPSGGRSALAYFDRPLFPETLSATSAISRDSGQTLDDWVTFYEGGSRLVEYLLETGYSGAVMAAYCEGSTLYPSNRLDPTPKYDTGIYFGNGQDPVRKDVLELLFQLFDRAGLQLVPALQFSAPLPNLQQQLRANGRTNDGIELIGVTGRTWRQLNGTNHGMAPYYNPLDERVQEEIRNVVRELVDRYGHHRSFAGVSLDLTPHCFVPLPGVDWGMDDRTIERFAKESAFNMAPRGPSPFSNRGQLLAGQMREAWLAWRSKIITQLFVGLRDELIRHNASAVLYLAGEDLVDAAPVQNEMWPDLRRKQRISSAMEELGMDAKQIGAERGIVFLRPLRYSPEFQAMHRPANLEFNESDDVDRMHAADRDTGYVLYHDTHTLRLPEFDRMSPFGQQKTYTWLASRFSPSGTEARRRLIQGLASSDMQVFLDGGWAAPMQYDNATREFLNEFRRLPRASFRTPRNPAAIAQPLVVRLWSHGDQTRIYVLNDSPWSVKGSLGLSAAKQFDVRLARDGAPPATVTEGATGVTWHMSLAPYGIVSAILTSANVTVAHSNIDLPYSVEEELRTRIDRLSSRTASLTRPPFIKSLENANFERPSPSGRNLSGWTTNSENRGVQAEIDSVRPGQARSSLRLMTSGPVAWIRSSTIPTTRTGRLHLQALVRTNNAQRSPRVRLVVEGILRGRPYYEYFPLDGENTRTELDTNWKPISHLFKRLPLTGLEDVRIGFDLMEPGTVWIDDVRVSYLAFEKGEHQQLNLKIAKCDRALMEKRYSDCIRHLNGFWPRFLEKHVPVKEQLQIARNPRPRKSTKNEATNEGRDSPGSVLKTIKQWVPKSPF